jgi:glutathione S-transferase
VSLVDLFYLPYGATLEKMGYDYLYNEVKWPNVARWWRDMASRDSWAAVKDGIPAEGLKA